MRTRNPALSLEEHRAFAARIRESPVRAYVPRSAVDLFRFLGGAGQSAYGADKGRNLAPACDRPGGVAAVLERVPIALRRARRQPAVQPAAAVRHRRRLARAPVPGPGAASRAVVHG